MRYWNGNCICPWLHEYTDISYNISKWPHLFPMNRYPCEYSWWYSRMYMAVLVTCSALVLTFFPIAFYLFVLFPKWWESPFQNKRSWLAMIDELISLRYVRSKLGCAIFFSFFLKNKVDLESSYTLFKTRFHLLELFRHLHFWPLLVIEANHF